MRAGLLACLLGVACFSCVRAVLFLAGKVWSLQLGRCLKERLQKADKGGHIILESIIFSLRYKAGPLGAL